MKDIYEKREKGIRGVFNELRSCIWSSAKYVFGVMEKGGSAGVGAEGKGLLDHVALEPVLEDKEDLRRRRGVEVVGGGSWQGTM